MQTHQFQFYSKVAIFSFVLGMGVELFMIKTGFYSKVTEIEAERLIEAQDQMSEDKKQFLEELYKQLKEKDIKLPSNIKPPT